MVLNVVTPMSKDFDKIMWQISFKTSHFLSLIITIMFSVSGRFLILSPNTYSSHDY